MNLHFTLSMRLEVSQPLLPDHFSSDHSVCVCVECAPWSNRTCPRPLSLCVHCVSAVAFCLLRDPSEMSPLERKS